MSVTSGFFNSVNHDRRYNAEQMSAIFNGIINDGVFINIGSAFSVTVDTGNKIKVGTGRAWLHSAWINNDAILAFELEASEILYDRIDAVVLETNHTPSVRQGRIIIKKGAIDGSGKKPVMLNTPEIKQMPIAYITRPKNSNAIVQGNIEYCVGTTACPFVTGILKTLNIDNLIAQWKGQWTEWFEDTQNQTDAKILEWTDAWDKWFDTIKNASGDMLTNNQAAFDEWFRDVQYQLSDDVAGHLLTEINTLKANTHNESHTTLAKKGWYRIARQINVPTADRVDSAVSCVIDITREWNNLSNESHKLVYTQASSDNVGFESLMDRSRTQAITKIRAAKYPGNTKQVDIYMYYDHSSGNITSVVFSGAGADSFDVNIESRAYTDAEIDSIGTEIVTYDIPDQFHLRGLSLAKGAFSGNIDELFGVISCYGYFVQSSASTGTQPWKSTSNVNYFLFLDSRAGGRVQTAIRFDTGEMKSRVSKGTSVDQGWYPWSTLEDYLMLKGGTMTGTIYSTNSDAFTIIDTNPPDFTHPLFKAGIGTSLLFPEESFPRPHGLLKIAMPSLSKGFTIQPKNNGGGIESLVVELENWSSGKTVISELLSLTEQQIMFGSSLAFSQYLSEVNIHSPRQINIRDLTSPTKYQSMTMHDLWLKTNTDEDYISFRTYNANTSWKEPVLTIEDVHPEMHGGSWINEVYQLLTLDRYRLDLGSSVNIHTVFDTGTYLEGNKGGAIICSEAPSGSFTMLDRLKSQNGYFMDGVYKGSRMFYYTAKSTVDAEQNTVTKELTLLDEAGNSTFPGKITAAGDIVSKGRLSSGNTITGSSLELSYKTPYIDFHYDNSGADFTSRIIEEGSGMLNIASPNGLKINGQALADQVVASGKSGQASYIKYKNGLAIVKFDHATLQDASSVYWVDVGSSQWYRSAIWMRWWYPFAFIDAPHVSVSLEIDPPNAEGIPYYAWVTNTPRHPVEGNNPDALHATQDYGVMIYTTMAGYIPNGLRMNILVVGRWK